MSWELWWVVIPAVVLWVLSYRSRAVQIFAVILAGLTVWLFPVVRDFFTDVTTQETSVVRNYTLDYDIAADGDMTLVETMDVEFNETRRGIFRFFDESDGTDPNLRHPVSVESVKRCPTKGSEKCVSEPFETYYENGFLVAKIGSASRPYPPGTVNRYVITSSTTDVLTQTDGSDVAQWYWDVIGAGWNMPIRKSTVQVTFPEAPSAVRCITDAGLCETATGDNPRVITGSYDNLDPRTPVTWQADLDPAGVTAVPVSGAPIWWKSPLALIAGAVMALLLGLLIWRLRERPPSKAPVFAAPTDDILPAVWTYKEDAPEHGFQTMLMQLQQLRVLDLTVQPDGQYSDDEPDWVQVSRTRDPLPGDVSGAADFVNHMGLVAPGQSVMIEKRNVTVGQQVQATEGALSVEAEEAAQRLGLFAKSGLGLSVHMVATLLPALSIVMTVLFNQRWIGAALLVPAVVGIWSSRSLRTTLTPAGMTMRDQVSGLRTALSTPASVERFDYALKARYFAQFLPWAVALECADEWAEACKPPPGTEGSDYDPTYSAAWTSYNASHAISTAVASVSAGAVAAYAATQSSSSSGGGGFSSGGGGGGGGGGSW